MITPPFSPQYFAVGRYSLLKIFFVCVCSKKNNVTFFSPRFFISFLLWKSKVGSAKVDFLPQSMPSGAMRVLMKVLAFLGTAQLACAHWVAMEVEGWLCCRARCRNCSGPTSVSLLFRVSLWLLLCRGWSLVSTSAASLDYPVLGVWKCGCSISTALLKEAALSGCSLLLRWH